MRKMQWRKWTSLGVLTLVLGVGLAATGYARDETSRATWLGVRMQSMSEGLKDGLDYHGDGGVLVSSVVPGSPAAQAGIRKGDVIVSINSRTVDTPDEVSDVVRSANVGQRVAIRLVRDGDTRTVTARLAARAESGEDEDDFDAPEPPEAPEAPETPEAPESPDMHGMHDFHDMTPDHVERYRISPEAMPNMRMFEGMNFGRGRLGVRVQSLTPELGEYFDVPGGKGVVIMEVLKDTPAERAGLRAGDVITHVGSRAVYDADDLVSALGSQEGHASLTVLRKGNKRTVETDLERSPRAMRLGPGGDMMGRNIIRNRIRTDRNDRPSLDREDRGDMRREIDQLKRQIDELQKELDQRDRDRN
jgi:membrane-associated protease RseP (regulator of RpoE activity)